MSLRSESEKDGKDWKTSMNPSKSTTAFNKTPRRSAAICVRRLAIPALILFALMFVGCSRADQDQRESFTVPAPELSALVDVPTLLPTRSTVTETPAPKLTPQSSPVKKAISESNLGKLAELRLLDVNGVVNELSFSPDGAWIAAASEEGTVSVWGVGDGALVYELTGHEGAVNSLAFSPDGSLLATGGADESVRLWDMQAGTLERKITSRTLGRILRVRFSPDGELIAVADHLCFVQLREVQTGLLRRTLAQPNCAARLGGTVSSWAISFSPDGERILTGEGRPCCGGSMQSWLVQGFQGPDLVKGYSLRYWDLEYAPDGDSIAVALLGSAVFWLMDPESGEQLQTFEGHTYRVNSVDFSLDGGLIVSGGRDYKVHLWRAEDGTMLRTLDAHTGEVFDVIFSADGSLLASGGADGLVILWYLY
jgi:WD40 repeat protein